MHLRGQTNRTVIRLDLDVLSRGVLGRRDLRTREGGGDGNPEGVVHHGLSCTHPAAKPERDVSWVGDLGVERAGTVLEEPIWGEGVRVGVHLGVMQDGPGGGTVPINNQSHCFRAPSQAA